MCVSERQRKLGGKIDASKHQNFEMRVENKIMEERKNFNSFI